ncbi:HAD domain-containing protein [Microbacterium aquimaris]|uniref:HAD domain-containing protein n=1 Tax=Microbacterium aquimaris TaxID=459816 RepID=UPI002AD520AC|nr:HAD domain-containing protein [Microbacterium aquimaris]MDZ8276366.1 HAD domain-containing protein [Microbacterium aquimaris]
MTPVERGLLPAAGKERPARPTVVALDIDGVLRVPWDPQLARIWPKLFKKTITMTKEHFPAAHHQPPPWDQDGRWTAVHGFSGVGVEWVRSLVKREDVIVVWASTWAEHANRYFSPVLGLPDLPVATAGPQRPYEQSFVWKARQLAAAFPSCPLLWIDDNPPPLFAGLEMYRDPRDRALTRTHLVETPVLGITESDVSSLDRWVERVSTIEGRRSLRSDWRKRR